MLVTNQSKGIQRYKKNLLTFKEIIIVQWETITVLWIHLKLSARHARS